MMKTDKPSRSLIFAGLTAIGASVCCVFPVVLLLLGIGGSWISTLTAMEPYRPIFVIATLAILAWVFYRLYLVPASCDVDKACANSDVQKNQRALFWVVTVILLLLLTFPYYGMLLLN